MKFVELNKTNNHSYKLRGITQEEMNEINSYLLNKNLEGLQKFLGDNIELLAAGRTSEGLPTELLDLVIPLERKFKRKGITKSEDLDLKEYKCYGASLTRLENNIQVHEDPKSSFKCALSILGNPKYAILTKERITTFTELVEKEATEKIKNELDGTD